MTPVVAPVRRTSGKGAQPAAIQRLRDTEDELTALHGERHDLGLRLGHISRMLQRAFLSRPLREDLVADAAGELDHIAGRLIARGGA